MVIITPPIAPAIDVKTFWKTLGERATGMTVVTADSDEGPTGFLGLSASHVAADPATMLVSIDRKTSALAGVLSRRHFAVNFLPADAAGVADAFAGKAGLAGAARFVDGEWTRNRGGRDRARRRRAADLFPRQDLHGSERRRISCAINSARPRESEDPGAKSKELDSRLRGNERNMV